MATTKISITVDADRLEDLKRLSNAGVSLSAVIDEALQNELYRRQMMALLDEMDARNPISPEDQAAGEKLWEQIQSSSIRARSRPSPKKTAGSARRSKKR
jgi:post-segregation antitoxin (ccd killing protein)